MKRLRIQLLAIVGCVCILSGVALLAMNTYTVYAQDELPAPEYVGADECSGCHRALARDHGDTLHALALQDVGRNQDPILGDFEQGEDLRTVTLPGEDEARAFTADDIEFAIGAGRHMQAYLYEVDNNDYMVLPAAWNVETGAWEAMALGDTWPSEGYDWEQNCAFCHTTGFDVERERWDDDGVMCEACHGPASNHVEAADDAGRRPNEEELLAIRSAIYTTPDSQVCGQCHSVGVGADNRPYPVGYTPGADLSEFFQLAGDDSPDHWWASGHASHMNMQYNEWIKGSHQSSLTDMQESDFADDKCLVCHSQDFRLNEARIAAVEEGDREGDPPDSLTVETAHAGITCTTCHGPHADTDQPSQLVEEANTLCMSCHVNPTDEPSIHHPVKEMFEGLTLVEGIEGISGEHFTAEDGPRCMTCHMQPISVGTTSRINHLFQPVLPSEAENQPPSACSGCHEDLTTTDLQLLIANTQEVVKSRLAVAYARLGSIPEPATDAATRPQYDEVVAALSFVQYDGSLGVHNYAYADKLLSSAEHTLSLMNIAGAVPQPTEAPAPTATPPAAILVEQATNESVSSSGIRPVTLLLMGVVVLIILTAGFFFFRKSGAQEKHQ
ncbi:MAG: hypothetical protein K8I30_24005 [Anaerolineae bacterium]|nr:hypothetical protein [Anaerolineae bacterium]